MDLGLSAGLWVSLKIRKSRTKTVENWRVNTLWTFDMQTLFNRVWCMTSPNSHVSVQSAFRGAYEGNAVCSESHEQEPLWRTREYKESVRRVIRNGIVVISSIYIVSTTCYPFGESLVIFFQLHSLLFFSWAAPCVYRSQSNAKLLRITKNPITTISCSYRYDNNQIVRSSANNLRSNNNRPFINSFIVKTMCSLIKLRADKCFCECKCVDWLYRKWKPSLYQRSQDPCRWALQYKLRKSSDISKHTKIYKWIRLNKW